METFVFNVEEKITAADADKKDLVLFQWLSALENFITLAEKEELMKQQQQITSTIINFINTTSPKPNRPIRNLMSRCLCSLYTKLKDDTRTLFDTLQTLQKILALKKVDDPQIKIAAISIIGSLELAHGSKVLSLSAESISSITKHFKNAKENELSLKIESLIALTKTVKGAGRGANEATIKDLMKIAKAGFLDKVLLTRVSSLELYEAIYTNTSQPPPLKDEYEGIVSSISKTLENSNQQVRQAAASALSSIIILSQQPPPTLKNAKKSNQPVQKTILSEAEMIGLLSSSILKAINKEVKVGIFEVYLSLIRNIGINFLESNYVTISNNLIELASNQKMCQNWNDVVMMREATGIVLRTIGKTISEGGQVTALQELNRNWLKKVAVESTCPNKYALVIVLNEMSALLIDVGSAAASLQDSLYESLVALLSHAAESVNIALCWTLRCFCFSLPTNLPKLLFKLIPMMQKDASVLSGEKQDQLKKFLFLGSAIASLITVVPHKTFYVSFENSAKVFGLATQLLKSSQSEKAKDFKVMQAQVQTAWTLIASLMTMGPNFVKIHLSQMLLFWKNVFTKSLGKDASLRTESEILYHLSMREAALGALHCFLHYNSKDLLTNDVAKRLLVCLNNLATYLTAPSSIQQVPVGLAANSVQRSQVTFLDRENAIRFRLFRCYSYIPTNLYETTHAILLKATIETFALDPEKTVDRGALANQVGDKPNGNFEFWGQTSLANGFKIDVAKSSGAECRGIGMVLSKDIQNKVIEELIEPYTLNALENDPYAIYLQNKSDQSALSVNSKLNTSADLYEISYIRPLPKPISICVVDSAIELFCLLFPLQSASVQEVTLENFIRLSKSAKATVSRRNTFQVNVLTAIIGTLCYIMTKHGSLASGRVHVAIRDLVEDSLISTNSLLRLVASEVLGRLSRVVGTTIFVNEIMQNLIDIVVNNREPEARAGASLAIGCINSYVGGMAAGAHLKTIVGILHSLASDPHPLVHKWALFSLWLTIDSAGLLYGPLVNSTLTVVAKLFMSESHETTSPLANLPTAESNADVYPCLGKILYALLGVVGPELSSSAKVRDLCTSLYEELKNDGDASVMVEAIKCIQHFILFSPKHMNINTLVPFLQNQLSSSVEHSYLKRKSSITCLYQLVQRDAGKVQSAGVQLEEQLFSLLDVESDQQVQLEIKDILMGLLKHMAPQCPSRWLELCKGILSKAGSSGTVAPTQPQEPSVVSAAEEDEENYHQDVSSVPKKKTDEKSLVVILVPRWRTQVFALTCLLHLLPTIKNTDIKEHFNLKLARKFREANENCDFLVFKLGDLVRIAFNAATANVLELNMAGSYLLNSILHNYAASADPDVEGNALLEQYQAQISAALTPAFTSNACSVEVKSLACQVAAAYVSSGINNDLNALGRVLKSLSTMLEQYSGDNDSDISPHGQLLLRLSILASWADIQNASQKLAIAKEVVEPFLHILAPQWVSVLRDYAKVRSDIETNANNITSGNPNGNTTSLDMYSSATRELTFPYYKKWWPSILQAVSSLIETHASLLLPLIGIDENKEPSKSFKMVYGLCTEFLSTAEFSETSLDTIGLTIVQNSRKKSLQIILSSFKPFLSAKIAGPKFLGKNIFFELTNIFDRLIQTEDVPVQLQIVEIIHQIVKEYGESYFMDEGVDVALSIGGSMDLLNSPVGDFGSSVPVDSKIYSVAKLLYNIFILHVPALSINPTALFSAIKPVTVESASLLVFSSNVITDLLAFPNASPFFVNSLAPVVLYLFVVFSAILGTEKLAEEVSPKLLIPIRVVLEKISNSTSEFDKGSLSNVVQGFAFSLLDTIFPENEFSGDISSSELALLKNCMLSLVLVHTTCPDFAYNETILTRLTKYLQKAITSNSVGLSVTALQCVKALTAVHLKNRESSNLIASEIIRNIGPTIFGTIFTLSKHREVEKNLILLECSKISVDWCLNAKEISTDATFTVSAMSILTPLLINMLVETSSRNADEIHNFALESLIKFLSNEGNTFKIIVSHLDTSAKVKFEKCFKAYVGGGSNNDENVTKNESSVQSIQLKSFG
ncbi:hypothetical protein HDU92_005075 [Lobulomyces angularis]|nr:hypothetical protein HDU92_005075 [Lobulomyces angularis]